VNPIVSGERVKNLSKIKHKIGVMSGKGGVRKKNVAVNLAVLFAEKNKTKFRPIFCVGNLMK